MDLQGRAGNYSSLSRNTRRKLISFAPLAAAARAAGHVLKEKPKADFIFAWRSRVTNYNSSLRSYSSKYSRPRLTSSQAHSAPPSQRTRKQSSLLTNTKTSRFKSGGFCIVRCDPTEIVPESRLFVSLTTNKQARVLGRPLVCLFAWKAHKHILRGFDSPRKARRCFPVGSRTKKAPESALFCTRDPTENRTPLSWMRTKCPSR
jgi:hypothetical protein